jgi:hypothetical protein
MELRFWNISAVFIYFMGFSHTVHLGLKKVVPICVAACDVSETIMQILIKNVTEGVGGVQMLSR